MYPSVCNYILVYNFSGFVNFCHTVACCLQQGRLSTKSYLEQFVSTARPPIKDTPNRRSYCRDDLAQFIDDDASEIIDERDYAENAHPHQPVPPTQS